MEYEINKTIKGKIGEDTVLRELKSIFGEDALFFQNILIPQKNNSSKTFECDIICVSCKGIFVFEVKNWEGHIEANMLSQKWGFKSKSGSNYSQFDNPVMQNEMHRTALSELLGEQITSIVVLNDINNYFTINRYSADLVNVPVLLSSELKDYFSNNYTEDKYSNQQLYALYSKISNMENESNRIKADRSKAETDNNSTNQPAYVVPNNTSYSSPTYQYTNSKRTRKKTSVGKIIVIVILCLFISGFFINSVKRLLGKTSKPGNNKTIIERQAEIPEVIKNRHMYSMQELSEMPIVPTPDYQVSDMKLCQSLLYRTVSENYVENYENKTATAELYITPVEYIVGEDAQTYYNYLSKEFKYSRPLRTADNEQYIVVRLYVWYQNDKINTVSFGKERYEESLGRKNGLIKFCVDETSDFYYSNETNNREYITGLYIEDFNNSAIISDKVSSGTPIEVFYLIPISQDLDYTVFINPTYFAHGTKQARLILE